MGEILRFYVLLKNLNKILLQQWKRSKCLFARCLNYLCFINYMPTLNNAPCKMFMRVMVLIIYGHWRSLRQKIHIYCSVQLHFLADVWLLQCLFRFFFHRILVELFLLFNMKIRICQILNFFYCKPYSPIMDTYHAPLLLKHRFLPEIKSYAKFFALAKSCVFDVISESHVFFGNFDQHFFLS